MVQRSAARRGLVRRPDPGALGLPHGSGPGGGPAACGGAWAFAWPGGGRVQPGRRGTGSPDGRAKGSHVPRPPAASTTLLSSAAFCAAAPCTVARRCAAQPLRRVPGHDGARARQAPLPAGAPRQRSDRAVSELLPGARQRADIDRGPGHGPQLCSGGRSSRPSRSAVRTVSSRAPAWVAAATTAPPQRPSTTHPAQVPTRHPAITAGPAGGPTSTWSRPHRPPHHDPKRRKPGARASLPPARPTSSESTGPRPTVTAGQTARPAWRTRVAVRRSSRALTPYRGNRACLDVMSQC